MTLKGVLNNQSVYGTKMEIVLTRLESKKSDQARKKEAAFRLELSTLQAEAIVSGRA